MHTSISFSGYLLRIIHSSVQPALLTKQQPNKCFLRPSDNQQTAT